MMSIKEELHDELVEAVEVDEELVEDVDAELEEATEPKGGKAGELDTEAKDGEKAGVVTSSSVKASAKKKAAPLKAGGGEAMMKVSEDVDFEEDLDALVESEATLSEGFRAKAGVIFEAALKSKLAEEVSRLEESYEEKLHEEVSAIRTDLVEKVDGYLNYVVENWMEENELAVETGLRTEIAESFIGSLKDVFAEHYVEVPESKLDLVDELAERLESLEEKYSVAVDRNIELSEEVDALTREKVIVEAAEGLSIAQAEKLKSLVEDVTFEDVETFTGKVNTIKESYFKKTVVSEAAEEEAQMISEETVSVSPMMERYLEALKKSK